MARGAEIPAITCAEDIALFSLLHSVPNFVPLQSVPFPPSSNTLELLPVHHEAYALSLHRERGLASTFAFLAQTEDDPDHIPAVCIEQCTNSTNLNILFAVNKSRWDDGDSILHDLRQGFDKIFSVLARVSDRRDDCISIEKDVFAAIISMCSSRILQRLRLISIKRKPLKKPIKEILRVVIQCVKRIKTGKIPRKELQPNKTLFATKAMEVIRLIDLWHGHQTGTRLCDLVEGVHHLWQVGKLHVLFDLIPSREMDPSTKTSLLNVVGKVARYRETARLLYHTAKKVVLARRMKAIPVKLPQAAFDFPSASKYAPDLLLTISRIDRQYEDQKAFRRVWHLLNIASEEAASQFSMQVQKTLREAKIHAEIQLVAHCELKMSRFRPRVICSSKDACALCSFFILMHGKTHTPRSHGRLYPGWRLPILPEPSDLQQRFNKNLEGYIKESFSTLMLRRQKTLYPFPNESTLLTLELSVTTKESLVQFELNRQFDNNSRTMLSESGISHTSLKCSNRASPYSPTAFGFVDEKDTLKPEHLVSTNTHQLQTTDMLGDRRALCQGLMLSNCVDSNTSSPKYAASSLRIQIECAIGSRGIAYGVEWLTDEEATRVKKGNNSAPIIDAEVLAGEVSLHNQSSIYIATKEAIVRLDWHV